MSYEPELKTRSKERVIEDLRYWVDLSECNCDSELPTGGCMRCDLQAALDYVRRCSCQG